MSLLVSLFSYIIYKHVRDFVYPRKFCSSITRDSFRLRYLPNLGLCYSIPKLYTRNYLPILTSVLHPLLARRVEILQFQRTHSSHYLMNWDVLHTEGYKIILLTPSQSLFSSSYTNILRHWSPFLYVDVIFLFLSTSRPIRFSHVMRAVTGSTVDWLSL